MQTCLVLSKNRVNSSGRSNSDAVNLKESNKQSIASGCDNKTRQQVAYVKHFAPLYSLVHFESPIPGTPQIIRRAIHGGAGILVPNRPHALGVNSFVLQKRIKGKH